MVRILLLQKYKERLTDEGEALGQKEVSLEGIRQKPYFTSLDLRPCLPTVKMKLISSTAKL